jgi:hypothetical protein
MNIESLSALEIANILNSNNEESKQELEKGVKKYWKDEAEYHTSRKHLVTCTGVGYPPFPETAFIKNYKLAQSFLKGDAKAVEEAKAKPVIVYATPDPVTAITNEQIKRFKGTILEELFAKYPKYTEWSKFCEEAFKILDNLALKNEIKKSQYDGVDQPTIVPGMDNLTVAYLQTLYVWNTLKAIEKWIEYNKNQTLEKKYQAEAREREIQAFKDQQVREIIAQNNRDALPQQIARFERQIQNRMEFGRTVNKQFGRRLF